MHYYLKKLKMLMLTLFCTCILYIVNYPTNFFRNADKFKTRVIPNNVCIVISTQFNLNCVFRIDLIHLQQKSLQEYVNTITCTRILNLNSVRKLRVSNKQLRIKAVISKAFFCSF